MTEPRTILLDRPRDRVLRVTLNREAKRNALSNALRTELLAALEQADADPTISVSIIRGAGRDFSAGYDLGAFSLDDLPFHTAAGEGQWPRHLVDYWSRFWDLAKPVIAQVHGYCLAGGAELAGACDLVYVAHDARIGYPAVRSISPPDTQIFPWLVGMRRAMEMMLTGDALSGMEAVVIGFANQCFERAELDDAVVAIAERLAKVPAEIQQINKRAVHRAMEIMGIRTALRAGTELQTLASLTAAAQRYLAEVTANPAAAFKQRDAPFGDYAGAEG